MCPRSPSPPCPFRGIHSSGVAEPTRPRARLLCPAILGQPLGKSWEPARTAMPRRPHRHPPIPYREAGVDIDAGEALVEAIKPLAATTRRPGADATLGGFGALFDLKGAGYDDPL